MLTNNLLKQKMHKNTQDSDFDEDQKYSNFYAVN